MTDSALGAEQPLVTAIVSTYEGARFLPGCLDDLEAQTLGDRLEIVVVDSGSPQDEREIVGRYQRRFGNIVYVRTEERETIYAAWNRALAVARGRYVTNANVDDRHRRDALAILANALESNPEVALVYADVAVTETANVTFEEAPIVGYFQWPEFDRATLEAFSCVGPQPMWRRALHDRFGLFDEDLEVAGDYEWCLRLAASERFLHLPETLGVYLYHAGSVEHRDMELTRAETEKVRRRYVPERPMPTAPSFFVPVGEITSMVMAGLTENREWLAGQVDSWRAEAELVRAQALQLEQDVGRERARVLHLEQDLERERARVREFESRLQDLASRRWFRVGERIRLVPPRK